MKKIIAITLAVILAFAQLGVCALGTEKEQIPVVEVPGFMSCKLFAEANNPDSEVIWPPSSNSILKAAAKLAPYIALFGVDRNWDRFADKAGSIVGELFAPVCCDVNGEVTNGSGIIFSYPEREKVNKSGSYKFYYDWREDPLLIADQLNDFINYILECSGSDKVDIICHSLGGVITLSYLTVYGDEKIDGVCFYLTAIYGESYNGQLMSGNIALVADSLTEYMRGTFADSDYPYFLASIFDVLNKTGIIDPICRCGNYAVEKCLDTVAHEAVLPLFAQWTTIWSMVPDEYLDASMDYVFGNIYADDGIDHSKLLEKVENFNSTVRCKRDDTLKKLNENAKVIVISGYGYTAIPITADWNNLGDNNVDTKYSSFGATTAKYGEKLSESYLADADMKYINPDKTIDASTCLFPEQTWFVKDLKHTTCGDDMKAMRLALLRADEQPTVDTFEEYPRFLKISLEDEAISADTQAKQPVTFLQSIVLVFKDIYKLISSLFVK